MTQELLVSLLRWLTLSVRDKKHIKIDVAILVPSTYKTVAQ